MQIDLSTRVVPGPNVLFREIDGEAVLLDLRGEAYFGLNGIGTAIWHAATRASSLGDAVPSLLAQFEVDETTLTKDVLALAEELVMCGLLTVQTP
jgi:hypothetical protein